MPSKRALLERLRYEVEVKGQGEESCFYEDVEKRQKERSARGNRKEKFVLCTDDPELCARLEGHKDRIFHRVKNKSIMLSLMERAWAEALSDAELDRILAAMDAVESGAKQD
jgi:hypothetical protein